MTLLIAQIAQCRVFELENNELEGMWKETVMA
jgi:hypothetical protein